MITVSSIEASIIRRICFFPDAATYKCGEETLTLTADFNYNVIIHRRGNHILGDLLDKMADGSVSVLSFFD